MAETKFDYNSVSSVYGQMKNINENIKTLFNDIDKEMENKIQVEDEAVFGELGAQLLLSWDNISGCFPEFVDNFDNWSYLVAAASGNYSQFEQDVQAFKNANPLGVNSGGRQNSFISDSAFANALTQQELDDYASKAQFYQLTGATYIDTGMVSYLKKSDIWEGIGLALDIATIVAGGCAVGAQVRTVASLTTTGNATMGIKNLGLLRGGMTQAGTRASQAVGSYFSGSGFWSRFASTGLGSKITGGVIRGANTWGRTAWFASHLRGYGGAGMAVLSASRVVPVWAAGTAFAGQVGARIIEGSGPYNAATFQKGHGFTTVMGDEVTINNNKYNFLGQSSTGTSIYADANGNVVYQDPHGNIAPVSVKTQNGTIVNATLNNMDENSELSINGGSLGAFSTFNYEVDNTPTEDFDGYYDTISDNMEELATN